MVRSKRLQTAWSLAEAGRHVLVAVRDELQDSNTSKAQGGIAAALGRDDDPSLHYQDTLVAGAGLTDETMAKIVVTEGPKAVLEPGLTKIPTAPWPWAGKDATAGTGLSTPTETAPGRKCPGPSGPLPAGKAGSPPWNTAM